MFSNKLWSMMSISYQFFVRVQINLVIARSNAENVSIRWRHNVWDWTVGVDFDNASTINICSFIFNWKPFFYAMRFISLNHNEEAISSNKRKLIVSTTQLTTPTSLITRMPWITDTGMNQMKSHRQKIGWIDTMYVSILGSRSVLVPQKANRT